MKKKPKNNLVSVNTVPSERSYFKELTENYVEVQEKIYVYFIDYKNILTE